MQAPYQPDLASGMTGDRPLVLPAFSAAKPISLFWKMQRVAASAAHPRRGRANDCVKPAKNCTIQCRP
ncbi:hypothetical protein RBWH47_00547 [Rhodopirellula baltica WH47]|uniref:Uncharacterized protein n=1 Tax=Rhodopirellula baltica WH47 TaxID=991778 RepID=F2ARQ8_RHOBT|nr:hypothetical protein RBWH47_00547 [Rhodopirellula baltica WH47]